METLVQDNKTQTDQDINIFRMADVPDQVTFSDEKASDGNNIKLTLYDGSVHKHWYWGNMAFDLDSIKASKAKTPVLLDHNTSHRIGVGRLTVKDGKLTLIGKLLSGSKLAAQIKSDAADGFPFESSLRFDSRRTSQVELAEGDTRTVNGHKITGPGVVFQNTHIMEGSIVTFGEMPRTAAHVFDKSMNGDQLKKYHPELYKQVFAAGVAEGMKQADEFTDRKTNAGGSAVNDFLGLTQEQRAKIFANDSGLQAEFGEVESFEAYIKAVQNGKVRIMGK